jgi:hypothetical protein
MAATYLDFTLFPKHALAGLSTVFRLTARDASAITFAGYTGTVVFTSTDPAAILPAPYTFVPGTDFGTHLFRCKLDTTGPHTVTASDGVILPGTARTTTVARPVGWGLDDFGLLPYGDASAGVGSALASARVFSTREVDVTVTHNVQDISPSFAGDALNPTTWMLQRLDSLAFFTITGVTQVGTFTYRLQTFEQLGNFAVTHTVSSSTLKDVAGNVIGSPHSVNFLGLLDANLNSNQAKLAKRNATSTDYANAQIPGSPFFAGTLQIDAGGDYASVTGSALVSKLVLRRLTTKPGDFFHLPNYGLGLRVKEPVPQAELPKLKAAIENQVLREPEVDQAQASVTMDAAHNILTVKVAAVLKKTGAPLAISIPAQDAGVSF